MVVKQLQKIIGQECICLSKLLLTYILLCVSISFQSILRLIRVAILFSKQFLLFYPLAFQNSMIMSGAFLSNVVRPVLYSFRSRCTGMFHFFCYQKVEPR